MLMQFPIPATTLSDFIGVILFFVGVLLILAGAGIIGITQHITITQGKKTLIAGIIFSITGGLLLFTQTLNPMPAKHFDQEYFPPGSYKVELYIGSKLEQVGYFTVAVPYF